MKYVSLVILSMLLASCGGGAGSSASSSNETTNRTSAEITTGTFVAASVYLQRNYSLGIDASYSCSGNSCTITGEMHHYIPGFNSINYTQIANSNLIKNGEWYTGTITTSHGQSYNVNAKFSQGFMAIDNGVNCTKTSGASSASAYDSSLAAYANQSGALSFNSLTIGQCNL